MAASQPDACRHTYLIARVAVCCHCERLHVLAESGDAPSQRAVLERLQPQQQRITRLLADGRTHAEVAQAMGLSYHTITNQVRDIHKRLGVSSRHEVILMYFGLLPLPDIVDESLEAERHIEQAPTWQTAYHGPTHR